MLPVSDHRSHQAGALWFLDAILAFFAVGPASPPIPGQGQVLMLKEASTTHDVTSWQDIEFKENVSVGGNATAAGQEAVVEGEITEGALLSTLATVEVQDNAGSQGITVEKNESHTLPSGQYGILTVKSRRRRL